MNPKNIIAILLVVVVLVINAFAPTLPAWLYLLAIGLALVGAGLAMAAVHDMFEADQLRQLFDEPDEHRDQSIG